MKWIKDKTDLKTDAGVPPRAPVVAVMILGMIVLSSCISRFSEEREAWRNLLRGKAESAQSPEAVRQFVFLSMMFEKRNEEELRKISFQEMTFHDNGRLDLTPVAKADIAKNRLQFITVGGEHPSRVARGFEQHITDMFGIGYVDLNPYGIVAWVSEAAEEYNQLMELQIRKRHPGFDLKKLFKEYLAGLTPDEYDTVR